MLNNILKASSYIFHPLFVSFYGICIYFFITVKYYTNEHILARLLQLFILTVIIPIFIYRVLKKIGVTNSLMMYEVKERRIPYAIAVALNLYITLFLFKISEPELHYFFAAITFTSMSFLLFSLMNYKASLHAGAISGLTCYTAFLSIHFQEKTVILIGVLLLINGLVATSRLHLKAHTKTELIIGFFMGVIPQFIMMVYWV